MNKTYLLADVIEWDAENWGKSLDIWQPTMSDAPNLHCLEIGSRRGGLALYAALNGHHCIIASVRI